MPGFDLMNSPTNWFVEGEKERLMGGNSVFVIVCMFLEVFQNLVYFSVKVWFVHNTSLLHVQIFREKKVLPINKLTLLAGAIVVTSKTRVLKSSRGMDEQNPNLDTTEEETSNRI